MYGFVIMSICLRVWVLIQVCSCMAQDTQRILLDCTGFGTVALVIKYQFIRRNPTGASVASDGVM